MRKKDAMIHQAINLSIENLQSKFPDVKEIRLYKGEFEDGVDWEPVFPCLLVNSPLLAEGNTDSERGNVNCFQTLNVFAGINAEDEAQQDFLADAIQFLNTLNTVDELADLGSWKLKSVNLVGYFKGIEAYRIELSVERLMD